MFSWPYLCLHKDSCTSDVASCSTYHRGAQMNLKWPMLKGGASMEVPERRKLPMSPFLFLSLILKGCVWCLWAFFTRPAKITVVLHIPVWPSTVPLAAAGDATHSYGKGIVEPPLVTYPACSHLWFRGFKMSGITSLQWIFDIYLYCCFCT